MSSKSKARKGKSVGQISPRCSSRISTTSEDKTISASGPSSLPKNVNRACGTTIDVFAGENQSSKQKSRKSNNPPKNAVDKHDSKESADAGSKKSSGKKQPTPRTPRKGSRGSATSVLTEEETGRTEHSQKTISKNTEMLGPPLSALEESKSTVNTTDDTNLSALFQSLESAVSSGINMGPSVKELGNATKLPDTMMELARHIVGLCKLPGFSSALAAAAADGQVSPLFPNSSSCDIKEEDISDTPSENKINENENTSSQDVLKSVDPDDPVLEQNETIKLSPPKTSSSFENNKTKKSTPKSKAKYKTRSSQLKKKIPSSKGERETLFKALHLKQYPHSPTNSSSCGSEKSYCGDKRRSSRLSRNNDSSMEVLPNSKNPVNSSENILAAESGEEVDSHLSDRLNNLNSGPIAGSEETDCDMENLNNPPLLDQLFEDEKDYTPSNVVGSDDIKLESDLYIDRIKPENEPEIVTSSENERKKKTTPLSPAKNKRQNRRQSRKKLPETKEHSKDTFDNSNSSTIETANPSEIKSIDINKRDKLKLNTLAGKQNKLEKPKRNSQIKESVRVKDVEQVPKSISKFDRSDARNILESLMDDSPLEENCSMFLRNPESKKGNFATEETTDLLISKLIKEEEDIEKLRELEERTKIQIQRKTKKDNSKNVPEDKTVDSKIDNLLSDCPEFIDPLKSDLSLNNKSTGPEQRDFIQRIDKEFENIKSNSDGTVVFESVNNSEAVTDFHKEKTKTFHENSFISGRGTNIKNDSSKIDERENIYKQRDSDLLKKIDEYCDQSFDQNENITPLSNERKRSGRKNIFSEKESNFKTDNNNYDSQSQKCLGLNLLSGNASKESSSPKESIHTVLETEKSREITVSDPGKFSNMDKKTDRLSKIKDKGSACTGFTHSNESLFLKTNVKNKGPVLVPKASDFDCYNKSKKISAEKELSKINNKFNENKVIKETSRFEPQTCLQSPIQGDFTVDKTETSNFNKESNFTEDSSEEELMGINNFNEDNILDFINIRKELANMESKVQKDIAAKEDEKEKSRRKSPSLKKQKELCDNRKKSPFENLKSNDTKSDKRSSTSQKSNEINFETSLNRKQEPHMLPKEVKLSNVVNTQEENQNTHRDDVNSAIPKAKMILVKSTSKETLHPVKRSSSETKTESVYEKIGEPNKILSKSKNCSSQKKEINESKEKNLTRFEISETLRKSQTDEEHKTTEKKELKLVKQDKPLLSSKSVEKSRENYKTHTKGKSSEVPSNESKKRSNSKDSCDSQQTYSKKQKIFSPKSNSNLSKNSSWDSSGESEGIISKTFAKGAPLRNSANDDLFANNSTTEVSFKKSPTNEASFENSFTKETSFTKNPAKASLANNSANEALFAKSPANEALFANNRENKELFSKGSVNEGLFMKGSVNEGLFVKESGKEELFGKGSSNEGLFEENSLNKALFTRETSFAKSSSANKALLERSSSTEALFAKSSNEYLNEFKPFNFVDERENNELCFDYSDQGPKQREKFPSRKGSNSEKTKSSMENIISETECLEDGIDEANINEDTLDDPTLFDFKRTIYNTSAQSELKENTKTEIKQTSIEEQSMKTNLIENVLSPKKNICMDKEENISEIEIALQNDDKTGNDLWRLHHIETEITDFTNNSSLCFQDLRIDNKEIISGKEFTEKNNDEVKTILNNFSLLGEDGEELPYLSSGIELNMNRKELFLNNLSIIEGKTFSFCDKLGMLTIDCRDSSSKNRSQDSKKKSHQSSLFCDSQNVMPELAEQTGTVKEAEPSYLLEELDYDELEYNERKNENKKSFLKGSVKDFNGDRNMCNTNYNVKSNKDSLRSNETSDHGEHQRRNSNSNDSICDVSFPIGVVKGLIAPFCQLYLKRGYCKRTNCSYKHSVPTNWFEIESPNTTWSVIDQYLLKYSDELPRNFMTEIINWLARRNNINGLLRLCEYFSKAEVENIHYLPFFWSKLVRTFTSFGLPNIKVYRMILEHLSSKDCYDVMHKVMEYLDIPAQTKTVTWDVVRCLVKNKNFIFPPSVLSAILNHDYLDDELIQTICNQIIQMKFENLELINFSLLHNFVKHLKQKNWYQYEKYVSEKIKKLEEFCENKVQTFGLTKSYANLSKSEYNRVPPSLSPHNSLSQNSSSSISSNSFQKTSPPRKRRSSLDLDVIGGKRSFIKNQDSEEHSIIQNKSSSSFEENKSKQNFPPALVEEKQKKGILKKTSSESIKLPLEEQSGYKSIDPMNRRSTDSTKIFSQDLSSEQKPVVYGLQRAQAAITRGLDNGNIDSVLKILANESRNPLAFEIAQCLYDKMKERSPYALYKSLLDKFRQGTFSRDPYLKQILVSIGITLVLSFVPLFEWKAAYSFLSLLYELSSDLKQYKSLRGEFSQLRIGITCCEIFMYNGELRKAVNILIDFHLVYANHELWLLDGGPGDFVLIKQITNMILVQLKEAKQYRSMFMFFVRIYKAQGNLREPIDMERYYEDLLTNNKRDMCLKLYEMVNANENIILSKNTYRLLIKTCCGTNYNKIVEGIFLKATSLAIYPMIGVSGNTNITLYSYWIAQEMYLYIEEWFRNYAHILRNVHVPTNQKITITIESKSVNTDKLPEKLKVDNSLEASMERLQGVMQLFSPPLIIMKWENECLTLTESSSQRYIRKKIENMNG